MEYSYLCGPLQEALTRFADLQKEKEETERLQKEKDELVSVIIVSIILFVYVYIKRNTGEDLEY